MSIKITLKDPNGVHEGLRQIEDEDLRDEVMSKFFTYGEYLTIEVDIETMTAQIIDKK